MYKSAGDLVLSSEDLGWNGFKLSHWQNVAPQEATEPSLAQHLLLVHVTPQPVKVVERAESLQTEGVAKPGDLNLLSAGELSYCRWDKPLSFFRFDIAPQFLQKVALQTEKFNPDHLEITHFYRRNDPKILQVSHWLIDELQSGGANGQLYADSLANVLAIHLLQNYTTSPNASSLLTGQLSQQQVTQAIDYMHAHLDHDISLEELSQAVSLSSSYLARLFKQATGLAPHQYLINLRVNRAKELLMLGKFSISEIAAQVGFADQSHLNRHFKKILGITPKTILAKS